MISVCLAAYNGEKFIHEQLQSVLAQIDAGDEIILADDGSSDATVNLVQNLGDPRIKILTSPAPLGVVKNFERALSAARGDCIFLCDQDDIWLPGKVQACLQALQTHLLVVTDCTVTDAELNPLHPSFFRLRDSGPGILKNIIKNSYLGCCMAFRRELLTHALPIPRQTPMHDMWLGMLAEYHGSVFFLPNPYILYRRHGHNATPTAGQSSFSLLAKLRYRLTLARLLAARCWMLPMKKLILRQF